MSEKGRVREGAKRVSPSRVKANVRSPISLLCTQPSQRRPRFRDWRAGLTMVCTTSFTEHPVRFRSHSADPLRDRLAPPNSPRRKNPHPRPRCRDRPDMCVVLAWLRWDSCRLRKPGRWTKTMISARCASKTARAHRKYARASPARALLGVETERQSPPPLSFLHHDIRRRSVPVVVPIWHALSVAPPR